MKFFLINFFVFLGVIFFLILSALGYIYATNMFNVRALFSDGAGQVETTKTIDKNPLIPQSQEKVLESIGVDPAKLPTKITPAMGECFDRILGKDRTQEIKNGSSPTVAEFLRVESCL